MQSSTQIVTTDIQFYRPVVLPVAQSAVSVHWSRQSHYTDFFILFLSRFFHRPTAQALNVTFEPRNSRKPSIFGPDFDGTKFFGLKPLQWGCSHVNSLNRHCSPIKVV